MNKLKDLAQSAQNIPNLDDVSGIGESGNEAYRYGSVVFARDHQMLYTWTRKDGKPGVRSLGKWDMVDNNKGKQILVLLPEIDTLPQGYDGPKDGIVLYEPSERILDNDYAAVIYDSGITIGDRKTGRVTGKGWRVNQRGYVVGGTFDADRWNKEAGNAFEINLKGELQRKNGKSDETVSENDEAASTPKKENQEEEEKTKNHQAKNYEVLSVKDQEIRETEYVKSISSTADIPEIIESFAVVQPD